MAARQKIHQAQLVSAAWRIIEPGRTTCVKTLMKRYGLSKRQLRKAVLNLLNGNFKKDTSWNPIWDDEDVIHHPVDCLVMTDIENGSSKGACIDLLMDPDFDSLNGVCHYKWGMDEVLVLCEGLPYRLLSIVRNSKNEDALYQEALSFLECDYFKLICKAFGFDTEELIRHALYYRSKPELRKTSKRDNELVEDSTGSFVVCLNEVSTDSAHPLLDVEQLFI